MALTSLLDTSVVTRLSNPQVRDAIEPLAASGQRAFGENYIQEAVDKLGALRDLPLEWHCIGPIQSNKTRPVAEQFDWVHTLDRLKIAERLSAQRPDALAPLNVCIQVNIDGGAAKSGVAPADALALAQAVAALPRLRLRGLMTIPEPSPDFESARAVHARTKALFDQLNAHGLGLDTLSMGMSADLEAAIAAVADGSAPEVDWAPVADLFLRVGGNRGGESHDDNTTLSLADRDAATVERTIPVDFSCAGSVTADQADSTPLAAGVA